MNQLPYSTIVLFEDEVARSKRFLPLTYTRPTSLLRIGMYTMLERLQLCARDAKLILHSSSHLQEATIEATNLRINADANGAVLFLNSTVLLTRELLEHLATLPIHNALEREDRIIAAHLNTTENLNKKLESGQALSNADFGDVRITPHHSELFDSLWSLIHYNNKAILSDLELTQTLGSIPRSPIENHHHIFTHGDDKIFIHPTAKVGLGTVLDAADGPIIIEEGVRIFPHATIMGPAIIGKDSLIKIGAKIYEGTSIGPVSKIGGEVENSIVLGYSNKQHDGYLGHSYLGEWVNLGADTNTSDLKNDYSPVRVTIEEEEFNTHSLFVGLLIGDHSKSAINTQFNTGTVVGVSCNVFDSGFPPKWIPNFSWGGAQGFVNYRSDKALLVAETVLNRRKKQLTHAQRTLLQHLADHST